MADVMKYCSACGALVALTIPEGDSLPRYVCTSCGAIHYQNPKIITGCIATWNEKILLCRRAIEPRRGLWTMPAGFMENNETAQYGAARETMEEAQAQVSDLKLFGVFNIPHISQVYLMFTGHVLDGYSAPGSESLETNWFDETEIPWQQLAFPVVYESLQLYFKDKNNHHETVHFGDIIRDKDNEVTINRY